MKSNMRAKLSSMSSLCRVLALVACAALASCNFLRNEFLALDKQAPSATAPTGVDSHP